MRTGRTITDSLAGISAPSWRASSRRGLEGIAGVAIGGIFGRLAGFTNQQIETTAPERISAVRQAAQQRRQGLLSGDRVSSRGGGAEARTPFPTEPRKLARPWQTNTPVRPITSFHTDSRYGGDLHRADMRLSIFVRERIAYSIID